MTTYYKASKSRSQNRKSWCMMFRHPLRKDAKGKSGLKIRRGLGTENESEAELLVQQMNLLLKDEFYWTLSSRQRALLEFDERVVNAFYENLEPKKNPDPWEIREELLPLPTLKEGYKKVQIVGTTGAGKTTLLRQFIGTDPEKERFPSTSTAKTTICDMEIIPCDQDQYEAVVTFFSYEKVRMYVEECVFNAGKSFVKDEPEQTVIRHLLEHTEQRFRLNYLLGNLTPKKRSTLFNKPSNPTKAHEISNLSVTIDERKQMEDTLKNILELVTKSAEKAWLKTEQSIITTIPQDDNEENAESFESLFEEVWKEDASFSTTVEQIMEEIENRFSFVSGGKWTYNSQEWAVSWHFSTSNRREFLEAIKPMTSNYANFFGKLITPLVQGIRIVGPFQPTWHNEEIPKLIFMDGEGIGHKAGSSISTSLSKKLDDVDAILLVDNAQSPMLTEPINVLKHIVTSGNTSKLFICFTHFDEVKGDNLPDISDKENHVLGSLENALYEIGKKLGSNAERHLMKQIQNDTFFFVGGIQHTLTEEDEYTSSQLSNLVDALESINDEVEPSETFPIYNGTTVALAIHKAAEEYYELWNGVLNLSYDKTYKQHWRRIQALSRRFAELGEDEYDGLKPLADMIMMVRDHIFISILDCPLEWTVEHASDELKQTVKDTVAMEFNKNLQSFLAHTIWDNQMSQWSQAYNRSGQGSTKIRAKDMQLIFKSALPEPHEFQIQKTMVHSIYEILKQSVENCGGKIVV